jgi:hypothetical protein
MKRVMSMLSVIGVAALVLFAAPCRSFADPAIPDGYVKYLDISAKIDGYDVFELGGNQWRWEHFDYCVPEIHDTWLGPDTTPYLTTINGEQFPLSTWPTLGVLPTSTGAGYPHAISDWQTIAGLTPLQNALDPSTVTLVVTQARSSVWLDELPNAGNGYAKLRVGINDDGPGGSGIYSFQIWGAPKSVVPEPISAGLFLLGGGVLAAVRKRRKA